MHRLIIAVACVTLLLPAPRLFAQGAPAPARMLVMPFDNGGQDPKLQWLGEASAVLVGDGLHARGIGAISRDERVRAFEELHLPRSASLSRATVIKVAQLLGAAELVTGTFRVQDRQITVEARIIRVDAGRVRPAVSETGALVDLFDLHERIVRRLVPDAAAPAGGAERPPLGAFESYVKGLVAESP